MPLRRADAALFISRTLSGSRRGGILAVPGVCTGRLVLTGSAPALLGVRLAVE
ncbi:hypothetical protein [Nonomuraea sp. NPDC050783]|uniref:hypothetical protein n=1 Tax=Nonomuraea sp. NPDC050783 TaxID=3154634 RepID=UPI003465E72F